MIESLIARDIVKFSPQQFNFNPNYHLKLENKMNQHQFSKVIRYTVAILGISMLLVSCSKNQENAPVGGLTGGNISQAQVNLQNSVGDRVFFEVDSSNLTFEAQNILTGQADWLQQNPALSVTIEGHADERGTRQYNFGLGARRANAVREYLVGLGVNSNRIRTVSRGKERPVALCNDNSCWSQNRRGVTIIDTVPGS